MKKFINSLIIVFTLDGIIFLVCILGILHGAAKVDLPIKFQSSGSALIIKSSTINKVQVGDTVYTIDGQKFSSQDEIEVYLDGVRKGDSVNLIYLKSGIMHELSLAPISFYSDFYLITDSISCLLFFLIGIFVLIKKPKAEVSKIFHWVVITTAVIMTTTWGNYKFGSFGIGYLLRFIFSIAYTISPILFLHFTLIFPQRKKFNRIFLISLYSLAFALGVITYINFVPAAEYRTIQSIHNYLFTFTLCRVLIAASIIVGVIIFIHSYKTAQVESEKKKLRWVLFGLIIGPLLFALLWVVPQAIYSYGLIPEESIVILMLAVPVTFAIAILKYHILDIDLIVKRSIIYSIVISILLVCYVSIIFLITNYIKNISEYTVSSVSAIIIAILFQPLKLKVQSFVDKKFFRVQYNFRIALKNFINEIKYSHTKVDLAKKIIEEINKLVPVEKSGFFLFDSEKSRIYLAAHNNFELLESRSIYLNQKEIKTELDMPIALTDKVETGTEIETADNHVFRKWGITMIFPMKSLTKNILGFLVLGEKKSGFKFSIEDVDLFLEVTLQAGLALDRIITQEELFRQQLIKERLEELNKLKSFFISSVSHELKTPLTSIKMFTEMLQANTKFNNGSSKEYLEIISSECDRLGRLIENVLDLSKIERGVKEYHFSEINIKALLCRSLELMSYQFKMDRCQIEYHFCNSECSIIGDSDSVISAVLNLLSNAIKYSSAPKKIKISFEIIGDKVLIGFENNGTTLSDEEIKFITEPYFRTEEVKKQNIQGSGIGLALVNQIMEAHNGKLEIQSIPNKGCKFILIFPIEKKHEADSYN